MKPVSIIIIIITRISISKRQKHRIKSEIDRQFFPGGEASATGGGNQRGADDGRRHGARLLLFQFLHLNGRYRR